MRIESFAQVQQLYGPKKPVKTQNSPRTGFMDQLQISSKGKDIQTAKAAIASSADIREDLTASIKASIKDGTYSVDMGSFADKLLEKYEELR